MAVPMNYFQYICIQKNIFIMKRNSFLLFVAILFTSVSVSFAQKKLSILGDSYSTYYGYVTPDTNLCWYGVPEEKRENDVKRVED